MHTFCTKRGTIAQRERELQRLLTALPCPQNIELKLGAQVMCTVNLDVSNGLCNGSQGIVRGFEKNPLSDLETTSMIPLETLEHEREILYPLVWYPFMCGGKGKQVHMVPNTWMSDIYQGLGVRQVPLTLSWAMTIHKAQGATLDCLEADVGKEIFEFGQTYVALSRVRSLDRLFLNAFDPARVQVNPLVTSFYKTIPDIPDDVEEEIEEAREAVAVAVPVSADADTRHFVMAHAVVIPSASSI
jgi:ATP-dependent DNA helicase PIF1